MLHYLVVLHKDPTSSYGVTVPDLPGCFSGGDTIEEALSSVSEAIELHMEGLLEDGDGIPEQLGFERHRDNPDFADGIWAVIAVQDPRLSLTST